MRAIGEIFRTRFIAPGVNKLVVSGASSALWMLSEYFGCKILIRVVPREYEQRLKQPLVPILGMRGFFIKSAKKG